MPEIASNTMTQAQFARHLGVSQAMVSKHKRNGRLITDAEGLVRVQETLTRISSTSDPTRARKTPPAPDTQRAAALPQDLESDLANSFQLSRQVKQHYEALKEKAEYEKIIGKLIDADSARAAGAELGVMFRNALETWPDRLAPVLAAEREESVIRTLLAEHAESLLIEIERRITDLLNRP